MRPPDHTRFSSTPRPAPGGRPRLVVLPTPGDHLSDPFPWDWASWSLSFPVNYHPRLWLAASLSSCDLHILWSPKLGEGADGSHGVFSETRASALWYCSYLQSSWRVELTRCSQYLTNFSHWLSCWKIWGETTDHLFVLNQDGAFIGSGTLPSPFPQSYSVFLRSLKNS